MKKSNKSSFHDDDFSSGKFAPDEFSDHNNYENNDIYGGFSNKSDYFWDCFIRYIMRAKEMMYSSLLHLKNPFTIIVIILLVVLYILLGVAGNVNFSFYSGRVVQYINTNLDIVVNAFLGFFYGPVTCAISVGLCCIAKIIANRSNFFFGYLLGAVSAGFIHGWILYRMKPIWFKPIFQRFQADLLAKVFITRIIISVFVNILLMSVLYKVFVGYPFYYFFKYYSKSGVPLNSIFEFIKLLIVSIIFESAVVYAALIISDFVAKRAFPDHFEHVSIVVNSDGEIENIEYNEYDEDF